MIVKEMIAEKVFAEGVAKDIRIFSQLNMRMQNFR